MCTKTSSSNIPPGTTSTSSRVHCQGVWYPALLVPICTHGSAGSCHVQHARSSSERSFLSFFTYKFVPISSHEYGGFTSRKIPKPQNLYPELKINLLSKDPNSALLLNKIGVPILYPNLIFAAFIL